MATTIEFTVPAVPVGQPRPRATISGKHARVHEQTHIKQSDGTRKPHPIAAFKACVAHAMREAYQGPPISGPVSMDIDFVFPRPKVRFWTTKKMPRERHTIKPDRDNCEKAVLDALKGLLFVDDSQVCAGEVRKWVASGYEQPHVRIVVSQIHESEEPQA